MITDVPVYQNQAVLMRSACCQLLLETLSLKAEWCLLGIVVNYCLQG